jgi:DNA-binding response OmpR family regulator
MKNIYVLEDDNDIREIIEILLTEEGYSVSGFATATSFKNEMKSSEPDIIVLDVMLPDGNGLDICNDLKSNIRTKNIPVIIMSANTNISLMKEKCKAEGFISKPFDIDDFVNRIDVYAKLD